MAISNTCIFRTSILFLNLSIVSAGATEPRSAVVVSTYDFAQIGSKTLAQAEGVAARIFALAGIDTRWITTPVSAPNTLMSDFTALSGSECKKPLPSAVVQVEIFSHAPNGFAPQALGYSLPCAERGAQVTITRIALRQ